MTNKQVRASIRAFKYFWWRLDSVIWRYELYDSLDGRLEVHKAMQEVMRLFKIHTEKRRAEIVWGEEK